MTHGVEQLYVAYTLIALKFKGNMPLEADLTVKNVHRNKNTCADPYIKQGHADRLGSVDEWTNGRSHGCKRAGSRMPNECRVHP